VGQLTLVSQGLGTQCSTRAVCEYAGLLNGIANGNNNANGETLHTLLYGNATNTSPPQIVQFCKICNLSLTLALDGILHPRIQLTPDEIQRGPGVRQQA